MPLLKLHIPRRAAQQRKKCLTEVLEAFRSDRQTPATLSYLYLRDVWELAILSV